MSLFLLISEKMTNQTLWATLVWKIKCHSEGMAVFVSICFTHSCMYLHKHVLHDGDREQTVSPGFFSPLFLSVATHIKHGTLSLFFLCHQLLMGMPL